LILEQGEADEGLLKLASKRLPNLLLSLTSDLLTKVSICPNLLSGYLIPAVDVRKSLKVFIQKIASRDKVP
jgi:hypothetical protein